MKKTPVQSLTPLEAHKLLEEDARAVLVDVRSHMEFLFVGHPVGAINVPWIDEPNWKVNPHFVPEVRRLLLGGAVAHGDIEGAPVILVCRSGKRSIDAGEALINDGFTRVYNVLEGFEGDLDHQHRRSSIGGWRFHGLPWEQC